MATKYFALLTNIGAAKLANATALGAQVEITQMAVGDGNGALPTPNPAQTTLTHELRRAQLNMLTIDPVNTNQIIAEQVIPEDVGGWWIREIGLFDKDGDMIAIANCAETYKPQLQEGSGRVQVIRVILIVSNTEAVTLKIDPSVVLATRGYVDNLIETRQQKSDTLTALAALKPAKGKLPYFTAEKAAALADLSDFIRLMLNKGDAAGVLEYLGLGELALAGATTGAMLVNGYVAIPLIISGVRRPLIIQWGVGQFGGSLGDDAGYLNNFPFAFPSACYVMVASHVGHTPSGAGILSASAITKSGFRGFSSVVTAANPVSGCYVAIGG